MGTIVAIGGGEIRNFETLTIDDYIVNLTGKENPNALFIPILDNYDFIDMNKLFERY